MFLFTVTKPGLRQAGALALCAVCLAGTVTAAVRLAGKSVRQRSRRARQKLKQLLEQEDLTL